MAKKTKKQKRSAKLKTRQKNKQVFQDNKVFINEHKLRISFPDKTERLEYIKALLADFDNMIEKMSNLSRRSTSQSCIV